MTVFAELIQSGRIIDIILILVAAEALLLITINKLWRRGPHPMSLLANLAAEAPFFLQLVQRSPMRARLSLLDFFSSLYLLTSGSGHALDLEPFPMVRTRKSALDSCFVAFSSTNRFSLRRKML